MDETTTSSRRAPLEGVLVVEVGVFMAAPFATMQLADLGARVVKVEPVDGDPVRRSGPFVDGEGSVFLRLNRNKESVVLDLKSEEGRDVFGALVERADVLVENLRPGALDRLGFGASELLVRNPGLVYASASGWGRDGPDAGGAGLDIMAQARSGLMSITGHPHDGPAKVGVPVCDLVCGLYLALGVMAALRHRDATGEGQVIDVSLLEAGLSLAVWEAGRFFATGEVPGRLGSAHQSQAPYQAVRAADGWITVGAITPATWEAFCAVLDRPDLLESSQYVTASARHDHREELVSAIEASTSSRTVADLVAAFQTAGVPCAPIQDYEQAFADPQVTARGFLWDGAHPALGTVEQLGSPMRFSTTPTRRDHAGPSLGADTVAVLAELGFATETTP